MNNYMDEPIVALRKCIVKLLTDSCFRSQMLPTGEQTNELMKHLEHVERDIQYYRQVMMTHDDVISSLTKQLEDERSRKIYGH